MKSFNRSLLALACCSSTLASAQTTSLETVQVTASRYAQTADQALASVSVITRDDIEQSQALTIKELLVKQAGISVTNSGGRGKSSGVFVRGAASDQLLVLVDGVRVGSATLGSFSFEELNLSQVERIEIVRGPRSSLYGSDAAGGVIQIFTRRGDGKLSVGISTTIGSDNTQKGSVNLSAGSEQAWFNANISREKTDGFDAQKNDEFDDDGYASNGVEFRAGAQVTDNIDFNAFYTLTDSDNKYDGYTNNSEIITRVVGVNTKIKLTDSWDLKATLGRSADDYKAFRDRSFSSQAKTNRDTFTLQNDFYLDDDVFTIGGDILHDQVKTTADFSDDSTYNRGAFAQYLWVVGAHDVQLSGRYDRNDSFGSSNTGGVAWGYQWTNEIRSYLNYGSAYRAPSFNELFYPNYGNPDISPEKSNNLELGISANFKDSKISAAIYETRYKDLIATDSRTGNLGNIDKARIRGIELSANYYISGWTISGNATFIDATDQSSSSKGTELVRRPPRIFNLSADRAFNKLLFGIDFHTQARSLDRDYDASYNQYKVRLGGFATTDLRLGYAVSKSLSVRAKVSNVFDKEYETVSGYNQPDRQFLLTVAYQPK
ncbi:TonB-dependent receptor domain-containing protein [Neptunomonas sp.]|uniref:TonB-dependent receptor domain-containing protein n=1 Tax=Neptunomonas TaxID=75687 RepID=UPI003518C9D6